MVKPVQAFHTVYSPRHNRANERMIHLILLAVIPSLFIGELKQGPIELYWSIILGVVCIGLLLFKKGRGSTILPRIQQFILLTFAAYVICSVFSRDIGFSVSSVLRLLSGFVALYSGSLLSNEKTQERFSIGLLIIGLLTALGSFVFRLFPGLGAHMPTMNLLFSFTGHNQAAYFWICVLPLSVHMLRRKTWVDYAQFCILIAAIVLSFSRGAWLFTAIYLLFSIRTEKSIPKSLSYLLWSIVTGVAILGIGISVLSYQPSPWKERLALPPLVKQQLFKSKITEESRFYNWEQALQAFAARPLVGFGPGSFWLVSRQFQRAVPNASALTHNFFLQTLSEVGLVGSIPLGVLFFLIGKELLAVRHQKTKHHHIASALVDGIFLSVAYSCFEYNLDYLTIWVLLFVAVGLLIPSKKSTNPISPIAPFVFSCVLLAYGLTAWAGTTLWHDEKTFHLGYMLVGYNENRTERFLETLLAEKTPLTPQEGAYITTMHAKTPEVLYDLALFDSLQFSPKQTESFYQQSIQYNPIQKQFVAGYMRWLAQHHRDADASRVYETFIRRICASIHVISPSINFQDPSLLPHYTVEFTANLKTQGPVTLVAAKSLYLLGLSVIDTNPDITRELWKTAAALHPGLSFFQKELASFYLYYIHDEQQAKQQLQRCKTADAASQDCETALLDFPTSLEQPGSIREAIEQTNE